MAKSWFDLMLEVAKMDDFGHLARLEDGAVKVREAREAVMALRNLVETHSDILDGRRKAEERRVAAQELAATTESIRKN